MKSFLILFFLLFQHSQIQEEKKIEINSSGWKLVGDLRIPTSKNKWPVVLMLNQAGGDRTIYKELSLALAEKNIGSLRLDLRGHGESTNLGKFIPGDKATSSMIWNAEQDVIAATRFLKTYPGLDSNRICIVGASYSGEEMAEAARLIGYAKAYVELSPGSFSNESIEGIDKSGVPWFFIVSKNERYLKEITDSVRSKSKTVEMLILPGSAHATDLLKDHPGLVKQIVDWIKNVFK